MESVSLALGILLVGFTLWDVFEGVIVPRPTPGRFRIGRYVVRGSWRATRVIARRLPDRVRDELFGVFGPGVAVLLLVTWIAGLILGVGLVLYGIREQIQPVPASLAATLYFAGSSVLTLGSSEFVAVGGLARIVVLIAATTGLGVVALVVTFLFSIYGSYQRRELEVIRLQATAGAPPSAVALLEAFAVLEFRDRLPAFFVVWQRWAAEVLDSHIAYPVLAYFRSSHDNLSWISSLGAVLDASSLVLTTIRDVPRGDAELVRRVGAHLVEDISNLGYRAGQPIDIDRAAFELAYMRLAAVGYALHPADEAWPRFEAARAMYANRLEEMANYWEVSATAWLGDMTELRSAVHLPEPTPGRARD
jgi:hypothetical protein